MSRAIQSANVTAGTWVVTDIVTDGPSPAGSTLELNTVVTNCSSYPGVSFFQEQYAFDGATPSLAASYADSVWTAEDGRQYIGEGNGNGGGFVQVLSAGEPILTLNPVAGEAISTEYQQSYTGCGGQMKPFEPVAFSTRYTTVEHLESFTDANGVVWPDVWHTTLVEWLNLPNGQKYYDYYFARNTGLVQADCWTANADHVACGRQDTLLKEAP